MVLTKRQYCATESKAEQQGQPVVAQALIATTTFTFELAGRRYEAVSFVRADEKSVDGDTAVARTDTKNGGGLGEEDGEFLWKHRDGLPEELRQYYLVFTKWRDHDDPRIVWFFLWYEGGWHQYFDFLVNQWGDYRLVMRRLQ